MLTLQHDPELTPCRSRCVARPAALLQVGYYISSYTTADGKPDSYTLTQFESTDARKAFPCWDEVRSRLRLPRPAQRLEAVLG